VFSKICESQEDLDMLLKANPETEFIMEYPIKGREFTVGIIESNSQTIPLPVIEIIPPGKFF
jgi:D-alanine-D-alanine ligase-like ATP-grasp enzyme